MPPLWSRSFCQAVERMALSQTVQNSTWMFPAIETTHLIAMIVLVGSITAFDLRLLGLAMQGTSVSRLAWRLLPATWTAFAVMAITGSLLFTSDPVSKYCHNPALQLKLILILLSGVNMAVFHFTIYHRVKEWDTAPALPFGAKLAGSFSVLLWAGVVVTGRWIGFI